MSSPLVILILSLLLGLQPITTDLYLPALPALTTSFGAVPAQAVLTLVSDKGAETAHLTAKVDTIAAADLAAMAPPLAFLGFVDAPISGGPARARAGTCRAAWRTSTIRTRTSATAATRASAATSATSAPRRATACSLPRMSRARFASPASPGAGPWRSFLPTVAATTFSTA